VDTVGNFITKAGTSYTGYGTGAVNSGHAHAPATVGGQAYAYDANGGRVSRARAGVTTVYVAGAWEKDVQSGASTKTRAFITLQGRMIAQRERIVSPASDTTIYLHGDHLGGVSIATSSSGAILSRQAFTPWGELRAGGGDITQTARDFTGQLKDDTGLLFYNARYYDPKLGRFASADSVAPQEEEPQRRNRYSDWLNNFLR